MKKWLPLLLCFLPSLAFAQGAVLQQGGVFRSHPVMWVGNGLVADAGGPLANGLSPVDPVTGLLPLGFASVNSGLGTCQFSGYASAAYSFLCSGFDGSGNGLLSLGNTGGSSPSFSIDINGTKYPFPGSGNGNAIMPTAPAIPNGDLLLGAGGTVIKDGGLPPLFANTEATLASYPLTGLTAGAAVVLYGYYEKGDIQPVVYQLQTSSCGTPDAGLQVASTTSGNCWLHQPQASYIPQTWGASGSGNTTTCGMSGSSAVATLGAPSDFVNGHPIFCIGAGATFTLGSPTSLTITTEGVTGSTQYCYRVYSIDGALGHGTAIAEQCAVDGNAVLGTATDLSGPAQYEQICWTPPVGTAPASYAVFGRSTGAETFIGRTTQSCLNDYGATNNQNRPSWISSSPTVAAQNDVLRTTIASGAGTTSVTLATPALNSTSGMLFGHDDTAGLTAAVNDVDGAIFVPFGTYNTFAPLPINNQGQSFAGCGPQCAIIVGWGTTDIIDIFNSKGQSGVGVTNILLDGSNEAAGDAININNSNWIYLTDIWTLSAYNGIEIGNNSFSIFPNGYHTRSGVNGEFNWHIWGTGHFGEGGTTQVIDGSENQFGIANPDATHIHVDGNVSALNMNRARLSQGGQGPELLIDNAIGASGTPENIHFTSSGFNVCGSYCVKFQEGHEVDIADSFIQGVTNSSATTSVVRMGPDAYTLRLSNNYFVGAPMWSVNFLGTHLYMSNNTMSGIGTGGSGIHCGGSDLVVSGGGTGDNKQATNTTDADYGIILDTGCANVSISGNWWGNIANIDNKVSPSTPVSVQSYPNGSPVGWDANIINTTGDKAITVASFPALYAGTGGRIATLDIGAGSAGAGRTYTFDTAAAIAAVDPIGTSFTIRVINHTNNAITIHGDTGTTPGGVTNIPANGGSGMQSFIDLHGVVTAGPAVALTGCSATAGVPCY